MKMKKEKTVTWDTDTMQNLENFYLDTSIFFSQNIVEEEKKAQPNKPPNPYTPAASKLHLTVRIIT